MADFSNTVLYFFCYAFLGWMLEVSFASIRNRQLTNRGFLLGPFCPLYGISSILILSTSNIISGPVPPASWKASVIILVLSVTLVTIMEYITGLIQERAFATRLWDYRGESFSLHGRICLKYSLFWGLLACVLITVIHPFLTHLFLQIRFAIKTVMVCVLIIYLLIDTCFSVRKHYMLKKSIPRPM